MVEDRSSTVTTALAAADEIPSSTTIYHPFVGRLIPEIIEVKQSRPGATMHKEGDPDIAVLEERPGVTKLAVLVASLLLTAMLLPMALAEPTSTSMTMSVFPTLSSSSPYTTAFNATDTVAGVNETLDLQEKDRPQTWYYHPPSSSGRTSTHPLLSLIPLLLALFFLLPSFAAGALEKGFEIIDDAVFRDGGAATNTSPVWEIFKTTTMVWPPAFTSMITSPPVTSPEAPIEPISVATHGGGCSPSPVEICTEANPAVCPIVLGGKAWRPV